MSEGNSEQEAAKETPAEEERRDNARSCGGSPHLPTILSVIAVLLAGYATISSGPNVGLSVMESKVENLEAKVNSNSNQLASLSEDVQKNRDSLIQARLKEVLLSIQEIKGMSDAGSRDSIAEAERILLTLTPDATSAGEPATEKTAEAAQPAVVEEPAETEPQTEEPQAAAEPEEQLADGEDAAADNASNGEAPAEAISEPAPAEQPAAEAAPEADSGESAEEAPVQAL